MLLSEAAKMKNRLFSKLQIEKNAFFFRVLVSVFFQLYSSLFMPVPLPPGVAEALDEVKVRN